jgi:hypothetical protein
VDQTGGGDQPPGLETQDLVRRPENWLHPTGRAVGVVMDQVCKQGPDLYQRYYTKLFVRCFPEVVVLFAKAAPLWCVFYIKITGGYLEVGRLEIVVGQ